MAKRDPGDKPNRKMPDGSPCWCVDDQSVDDAWVHSPRCLARRALSGGYDFRDGPPNQGARRNASQRQKKILFLRHLTEHGFVGRAANYADIETSTVSRWRDADPVFAEQMDVALEASVEAMEAEARRRGMIGYEKPVYQQGQLVGTVREYSDTLLIFMLKGAKPNRYRDNVRAEITGPGGGPVQTQTVPMVSSLSDHEKRALRRVIDQAIREAEPVPVTGEAPSLAGEPDDGA